MTFTHKLARRLAILRALPPHCAMVPALALIVACSAGVPTGVDTGTANENAPLVVNPRSLILEANQVSVFKAYASGVPGDSLVTSIEWTATGGSIGLDGTYSSPSTGDYKVVGKRHGPTRTTSDTAKVTVVPPQPTVTSVIVSPQPATVTAKTQQTFSAVGKLSDGSTVAIGVTWTATGGSIDPGGVYTAGSTPGTYQVIAKAASANVADTVAVAVTSPPPQSPTPTVGTYPNLPAGMTTIFEYDGSVVPPPQEAWVTTGMITGQTDHYLGGSSALFPVTVTDNTSWMQSPSKAMRAVFPVGMPDGISPVGAALWAHPDDGSSVNEFYMAFRIRLYGNANGNATFDFHPVDQKLFYFSYALPKGQRTNEGIIGLLGNGRPGTHAAVIFAADEMADDGTGNVSAIFHYPNVDGGQGLNVGPNAGALVEVYLRMNSIPSDPAPRDGTLKVWVNGHLTIWCGPGGPAPGLRFRSRLNPRGVFQVPFVPVFGGNAKIAKIQTDYIDFDHIYAAGR